MRSVEIEGARIAYVEAGDAQGEPVVLLHGYMGSHRSWRLLSHRYDYESEVRRLALFLDALGIGPCNLAGHDYGGFLALGLALRRPELLRRLTILNSRAHGTFTLRWALTFGLWSLAGRTPILRKLSRALPFEAIHRFSVRREARKGIFDMEERPADVLRALEKLLARPA